MHKTKVVPEGQDLGTTEPVSKQRWGSAHHSYMHELHLRYLFVSSRFKF